MVQDIVFTDVWADTSKGGVQRPAISLRYTGNTNPADDLHTTAPVNGIINYPDHIQPIWSYNRGANTCTTCHNNPSGLDLSGTIAGTGRMQSYERLMLGDPLLDSNGLPVIVLREGVYVAVQGPNLETRAEYRMLRALGADVVGMSTVPEVIVAVQAGMRVLGCSIITDQCVPETLEPASLERILAVAAKAEPKLTALVRGVLERT